MEPELQVIPTIIRVFINFLRAEGVFPIEVVGTTKELQGSEILEYEFLGNSKPKADEHVSVVIRTPGWKFGDTVISRPRAEELNS
jgi:hypothetical protein